MENLFPISSIVHLCGNGEAGMEIGAMSTRDGHCEGNENAEPSICGDVREPIRADFSSMDMYLTNERH